ncbi:MAG TPA: TMEM165/GDT1 family protein [Acidimicrobiales bacterium]|nr:TMEM165/GDT1 family protein [Acidimicrobiales bacterium]
MSAGVVAAVLALVFVAELPDKTMIATLVMGSRGRPRPVWAGASAAFVLHAALAVTAGRLLLLLPHRTVELVVTVLFLAGAAYLLVVSEATEEARGEQEARGEERLAAGGLPSPWRLAAGAFAVIAVGEFGDLTQLLLVNLVGRYHEPWAVFTGGALGLVAAAGLASFGGRGLVKVVPLGIVRRGAGLLLAGFGAYGVYTLVA